jgi:phosphate transport system protein
MSNDHILSAFDDALNELKEKTIRMGVIAQHNLKTSVMGILERDEARCNQVIASMKTAKTLERISDQTVNIAKKGRKMLKHEEVPERVQMGGLHDVVASMLSDALIAYRALIRPERWRSSSEPRR